MEHSKSLEENSVWETTPPQDDSTRDDEEANFWTITRELIYRHQVETRVKLHLPKEESFPIPVKYIDVTRTTYTWLDVMLETILKVTGTWMEKESCQIREPDAQYLQYWERNHRKDIRGPGEDLQGNKKLLVHTMYLQICGSICLMQRKRKQNKDGLSRNQCSTMPDNEEEYPWGLQNVFELSFEALSSFLKFYFLSRRQLTSSRSS